MSRSSTRFPPTIREGGATLCPVPTMPPFVASCPGLSIYCYNREISIFDIEFVCLTRFDIRFVCLSKFDTEAANCFNSGDFSHFLIFSFSWNVFTTPSHLKGPNYPWLIRTVQCTRLLAPQGCSIKKKNWTLVNSSAAQNMNIAALKKKCCSTHQASALLTTCTNAYIHTNKAVIIGKSDHVNSTNRTI
jgi:hypothetical protein